MFGSLTEHYFFRKRKKKMWEGVFCANLLKWILCIPSCPITTISNACGYDLHTCSIHHNQGSNPPKKLQTPPQPYKRPPLSLHQPHRLLNTLCASFTCSRSPSRKSWNAHFLSRGRNAVSTKNAPCLLALKTFPGRVSKPNAHLFALHHRCTAAEW